MANPFTSIKRLLNLDPSELNQLLNIGKREVTRPRDQNVNVSEVEIDPSLYEAFYSKQRPDDAVDPNYVVKLSEFLKENPDQSLVMPRIGMARSSPELYSPEDRAKIALASEAEAPRMTAVIDKDSLPFLQMSNVLKTPIPYSSINRYNIPEMGFSPDELLEMGILPDMRYTPESARERKAKRYLDNALENTGIDSDKYVVRTLLTGTDNDNNITSALQMETDQSRNTPSEINWLGSMVKGGGTQLMKEARAQSILDEADEINLEPADDAAEGFYNSLGMKRGKNTFTMSIPNNRGWLRSALPFGALPFIGEDD